MCPLKRTALRLALLTLGLAAPATSPVAACAQAKQFMLGEIRISGNTRTKAEYILRMIPLNPGDIFNQSKWELGLEQINRSGLFEPIAQTDVTQQIDQVNGVVNIELRLKERDHRRAEVSGGGGTTGGLAGGFDYSDINLTGRGDRLIARGSIGTREQSAGADYSVMPLTRKPTTLDIGAFYQRSKFVQAAPEGGDNTPLFLQSSGGATAAFFYGLTKSRYSLTAPTRVGLVYSFSSTNLTDTFVVKTTENQVAENGLRLGSLTPIFERDTLDRAFDPLTGERFVLSVELAARAFGGSLNTARQLVDFRKFFPLSNDDDSREPRVFALRARASYVAGFGEPFQSTVLSTVDGVPIFKRAFTGGETEVRGYDVNSIAPLAHVDRLLPNRDGTTTLLATDLRPIGGDTELIFNAEYRVPLIWRLSAAAFFDIGGSFNARTLKDERFQSINLITAVRPLSPSEQQLPSYRYSLGGEIRFPIPVLNVPLRLIFAFNPNAQRALPGSLAAPEHKFAFRFGFRRTL
jgi:outer membrane protein insertion porin family